MAIVQKSPENVQKISTTESSQKAGTRYVLLTIGQSRHVVCTFEDTQVSSYTKYMPSRLHRLVSTPSIYLLGYIGQSLHQVYTFQVTQVSLNTWYIPFRLHRLVSTPGTHHSGFIGQSQHLVHYLPFRLSSSAPPLSSTSSPLLFHYHLNVTWCSITDNKIPGVLQGKEFIFPGLKQ